MVGTILDYYRSSGKKDCTIHVIIVQDSCESIPEPEEKSKKALKKKKVARQASKVKQEPVIQQSKIKQEPAVQKPTPILKKEQGSKKRSFSEALEEPEKEEIKDEEDSESGPEQVFIPRDNNGVAYRTRTRHKIQPEDIERSAEFGIPI
jgi:hypothetical protein